MFGKRKGSVVVCECLALIMLVLVTGCQTLEQKEIAKLQGVWEVTKDSKIGHLIISGNNFELKGHSDKKSASGAFKINPEVNPKELDWTVDKHHNESRVGTTLLSIYKIENNKLFWAFNSPVKERPEKLEEGKCDSFVVFTRP
jgi:uncharacterized protein (TIGR03067 family)